MKYQISHVYRCFHSFLQWSSCNKNISWMTRRGGSKRATFNLLKKENYSKAVVVLSDLYTSTFNRNCSLRRALTSFTSSTNAMCINIMHFLLYMKYSLMCHIMVYCIISYNILHLYQVCLHTQEDCQIFWSSCSLTNYEQDVLRDENFVYLGVIFAGV